MTRAGARINTPRQLPDGAVVRRAAPAYSTAAASPSRCLQLHLSHSRLSFCCRLHSHLSHDRLFLCYLHFHLSHSRLLFCCLRSHIPAMVSLRVSHRADHAVSVDRSLSSAGGMRPARLPQPRPWLFRTTVTGLRVKRLVARPRCDTRTNRPGLARSRCGRSPVFYAPLLLLTVSVYLLRPLSCSRRSVSAAASSSPATSLVALCLLLLSSLHPPLCSVSPLPRLSSLSRPSRPLPLPNSKSTCRPRVFCMSWRAELEFRGARTDSRFPLRVDGRLR